MIALLSKCLIKFRSFLDSVIIEKELESKCVEFLNFKNIKNVKNEHQVLNSRTIKDSGATGYV